MHALAAVSRRWLPAAVWVSTPFTVGPALAAALDPAAREVQVVASVGSWLAWVVALVATLVPSTVSLTVARVVIPAAVPAAVWAAVAAPEPGWPQAVAPAAATLAAVVVLLPATGDEWVNGSSYGEERRMPLRPPGPLLLGPVEVTWAAVVAGAVAGPLLLAGGAWVAGVAALVVGVPLAVAGARALHVLARRWVVFVPAGMVLVDPLTLTDALLAQRRVIAALGPAPADSGARDLTAGALGLALELRFTEPQTVVLRPRGVRRSSAAVVPEELEAVLFSPTRPGAVLREAARRKLIEDPTGHR